MKNLPAHLIHAFCFTHEENEATEVNLTSQDPQEQPEPAGTSGHYRCFLRFSGSLCCAMHLIDSHSCPFLLLFLLLHLLPDLLSNLIMSWKQTIHVCMSHPNLPHDPRHREEQLYRYWVDIEHFFFMSSFCKPGWLLDHEILSVGKIKAT